MKKIILSKSSVLTVLFSFIFYISAPIYASTNKIEYKGLFLNKAKNKVLNNKNTLFNSQFYNSNNISAFYNLRKYHPISLSLYFKLNSYSPPNIFYSNLSSISNDIQDDYLMGKNDGKKIGKSSADGGWVFWDFFIPVWSFFYSISYNLDVPEKKMPANKSDNYIKGFTEGYKSGKRGIQMIFSGIGSLVTIAAWGGFNHDNW